MDLLNTPLIKLPGVGPMAAEKLTKLKLFTLGDLLFHLPRHWDDFSNPVLIGEIKIGENNLVKGTIKQIKTQQTPRGRLLITKAIIIDKDGENLELVWFNRPFLANYLKPESEWLFWGLIDHGYQGKVLMSSPVFEKEEGIYAVYPETEGLNSKYLRKVLDSVLRKKRFVLTDFLPLEIRAKYNLITLDSALKKIHFPPSKDDIEKAKTRLAFDELFLLSLRFQLARKNLRSLESQRLVINKEKIVNFLRSLPFELTSDQKQAAKEILSDLASSSPMNRILQGEVGSGKTIVSLMAALTAAENSAQSAWLAPTEILAGQHYKNIVNLKNHDLKIGLLTSNKTKIEKDRLKKMIADNKIDLIIGTHAILQEDVKFNNLGLIIVDEQHRFGVEQRAKLRNANSSKTEAPHFLSMTATPIPRTLALSLYSDLDISTIKELPKKRKPIVTKIVPPAKRKLAYQFIRQQIEKGRQVFVICPLIEPKEKTENTDKKTLFPVIDERKAAVMEYDKLSKNIFPDLRIGLLHGKLKAADKEKVMADFRERKMDILVSTSVVEVGIDIPNASVVMIESAERFGLAQLHQFRGRVGRGEHQSYCLLFTSSGNPFENRRLKALVDSNDGFALAEKDLLIRGPGELVGRRQSGLPDLKMASLTDTILMKKAIEAAKIVLDNGMNNYPLLADQLKKYEHERHLE